MTECKSTIKVPLQLPFNYIPHILTIHLPAYQYHTGLHIYALKICFLFGHICSYTTI